MKCSPSGRKNGQRCASSLGASRVSCRGVPPLASTRNSGASYSLQKMITPSRFHDAPQADGASQMICGGPPATAIRFSFPSAKKPTDLPSGDQNGSVAPCVDGSGRGSARSSCRIQSDGGDFAENVGPVLLARKTSELPSGENTACPN